MICFLHTRVRGFIIRTMIFMQKFHSIILFLLFSIALQAQVNPTIKTSKEIMDGFMDKRFGMFIHWGPVSLRGTEIGWSRGNQVPAEDYDKLYQEFDPLLFNADEWVKIAKDAGMKYITLTSKHHDGFCLWPSKLTEYDIMATPFKRDIVGELAAACKRQDIKFCLYFSILDWHDPNYPIHNDGKGEYSNSNMEAFRSTVKNQLREIITQYDPYMLWFDGQWESPWTDEMGVDLYGFLKTLKKDLIINNRLGKEMSGIANSVVDHRKMVGDYDTPEQKVGNLNMDFPWESCITICEQWSWKPNDKMKSLPQCLQTLIKTASGNGNLLFNVGPMMDGRIEQRQADQLKSMGNWLRLFGESIYETEGGPYTPNEVYSATRKGDKVFIHVFEAPLKELRIPALMGVKVLEASWMNGGSATFKIENSQYLITLPAQLPDQLSNVLVLKIDQAAAEIPIVKIEIKK
jgi:alpha-L-fucosidase